MKTFLLAFSFLYSTLSFADWKTNTAPSGATTAFGAIQFVNAYTGWAVGSSRTVVRTTNGGKTWTQQAIPPGGVATLRLNNLFFLNEKKGWVTANDTILLFTSNGGDSWQRQAIPASNSTPNSDDLGVIKFLNDTLGYVFSYGYDNGTMQIFKTLNGGQTWTAISVATPPTGVNGVHFFSNQIAVVSTATGIFKTTDGCVNWSPKFVGRMLSIAFADANVGVAGARNGLMIRTTNAGDNWSTVTSAPQQDSANNITGVSFASSTVGYACALALPLVGGGTQTGNMIKTTDAGATWVLEPNAAPTINMNSVSFANLGRGWACGVNNTIQEYFNNVYSLTATPSLVSLTTSTVPVTDSSIVIRNTGTDSLHVILHLTDTVFSITNATKFTLLVGKSDTVKIRFNPQGYGQRDALIVIESEAQSTPDTVHLTGTYESASTLDLASDSITVPTASQVIIDNESIIPQASFHNAGSLALVDAPVTFEIYDTKKQTVVYTDATTIPALAPTASQSVTFAAWTTPHEGTATTQYIFRAIAKVVGDIAPLNDTASLMLGKDSTTNSPVAGADEGIALAPNGGLYQADFGNSSNVFGDDRIIFYDSLSTVGDGATHFPVRVITSDSLKQPRLIALDTANNRLFVANRAGNNVLVFDSVSTLSGKINPTRVLAVTTTGLDSSGAGLSAPWGVALSNGHLIIAGGNKIDIYLNSSLGTTPTLSFSVPQAINFHGLTVMPDSTLAVTDEGPLNTNAVDGAVYFIDPILQTIKDSIKGPHTLESPVDVKTDTDGTTIYVADRSADIIYRFLSSQHGDRGSDFGCMLVHSPSSFVFNANRRIVYSNATNRSVDTTKLCVFIDDVKDMSDPLFLKLLQNYPNPFSSSTTITYELDKSLPVTLRMMDILGREVARLATNQMQSVGSHTVQFAHEGLGNGVYYYQLEVGNTRLTKMMTVLR